MPFTPVHSLAVLPVAAARRLPLPFSALVIGSMIPDFPLFVPVARRITTRRIRSRAFSPPACPSAWPASSASSFW